MNNSNLAGNMCRSETLTFEAGSKYAENISKEVRGDYDALA